MRLLEGSFTLYTSLSVRVSRIRAKLVCLSITSKQAKVAPEYCQAVQGWKWRCPLTDDVLVGTEIEEGHDGIVEEILKRLEENNLYVKPEKCVWKAKKIGFLGVVIGPNGIEMEAEKVDGVLSCVSD